MDLCHSGSFDNQLHFWKIFFFEFLLYLNMSCAMCIVFWIAWLSESDTPENFTDEEWQTFDQYSDDIVLKVMK